ncbi:hypothetical protein BGZ58_006899, partial [Dissophora ornata]
GEVAVVENDIAPVVPSKRRQGDVDAKRPNDACATLPRQEEVALIESVESVENDQTPVGPSKRRKSPVAAKDSKNTWTTL